MKCATALATAKPILGRDEMERWSLPFIHSATSKQLLYLYRTAARSLDKSEERRDERGKYKWAVRVEAIENEGRERGLDIRALAIGA